MSSRDTQPPFWRPRLQQTVVRRLIHQGVDLILPHHCVLCRAHTTATGLCADCWTGLAPITNPLCQRCGRPLPHATPQMICGACILAPPPLNQLRSLVHYNETSRALILKLKHGDGLFLAPFLARLMIPLQHATADREQVVIPVPLHRHRYFRRRFNQSAEIARALVKTSGHGLFFPNGLVRTKPTVSQGRLNRADRKRNVRGAFAVPTAALPIIRNQSILLVDDVFTTGATLFEAARTLTANGSGPVSAIVIARTLKLSRG